MAWFLVTNCPSSCWNYQKSHQVAWVEQKFSKTLEYSGIKALYVYHAHHSKNNSGGGIVGARSQEKMRMFYYVSSHSFYTVRTKKPKSENEGETVHLTIASPRGFCTMGHNPWRNCFNSNCAMFIIFIRHKRSCGCPIFNLLLDEIVSGRNSLEFMQANYIDN